MSDIETRFPDEFHNLRPAVWRDRKGVMHRAVGAQISAFEFLRLMWTACGKKDIPANSAWLQNPGDFITCTDCEAGNEQGNMVYRLDGEG